MSCHVPFGDPSFLTAALPRRYHGKEVLGLMGVEGMEESVAMCADGVHGGAAAHTECQSTCENEAGAEGLCVPAPPRGRLPLCMRESTGAF